MKCRLKYIDFKRKKIKLLQLMDGLDIVQHVEICYNRITVELFTFAMLGVLFTFSQQTKLVTVRERKKYKKQIAFC